jgi:hypothetical protein
MPTQLNLADDTSTEAEADDDTEFHTNTHII